MKAIYTNLLWLTVFVLLTASCSTPQKITYLRDMEYDTAYAARKAPELRLQPEDKINIQVLSTDPQLAAPFNATNGTAAATTSSSYTLDKNGHIDFPVLGDLYVEGMTVNEVKQMIASKIIELGYIREPIVKVEMENFSITILGENNNRILPVTGESINLLQVIAQAGSLNMQSKINDIMVIRTEGGQRTAYSVNLQTKDLFDSPVFYLQQNDIVYIKPRGLRTNQNITAITSAFSPIFSLGNILTTVLLWLSVK